MSLKGDKYETTEEVKFRLEQTVVMYEDYPVYISRVGMPEADDGKEIARVWFRTLPLNQAGGGKEVRKFLSSRNFSLAIPRLGYMNHNNKVVNVSRIPVRQNRQGLSAQTCAITLIDGSRVKKDEDTFGYLLTSPGFNEMVRGVYPDFREAMERFKNPGTKGVALSNSFAIGVDEDLDALVLYHKGSKCGLAFKDDKSLRLPKKFKFLKEELEVIRVPLS